MKLTKFLCLLAAAIITLSCVSCSSTREKAPVVTAVSSHITSLEYSWGTCKASVNTSIFILDKAIRRACARARLTQTYHAYHTTKVCYKFIDVDGNSANVSIASAGEGTALTIRIGFWGDEDSSRQLLVAIDEELKILLSQPNIED